MRIAVQPVYAEIAKAPGNGALLSRIEAIKAQECQSGEQTRMSGPDTAAGWSVGPTGWPLSHHAVPWHEEHMFPSRRAQVQ